MEAKEIEADDQDATEEEEIDLAPDHEPIYIRCSHIS